MEHIPASHAAVVGMVYPAWVKAVWQTVLELDLDLIRLAPGRSPTLRALLHFDHTVGLERARQLAPGDPAQVVLVEVDFRARVPRVLASLPADPAWLTWNDESVRRLARHIRTTREFGLMPILADALEEAGCADAALLEHCRQSFEGTHSWAVELLATQQ